MNVPRFVLILSLILPGSIGRSNLPMNLALRVDSRNDTDVHYGDQILTQDQIDGMNKETTDRNDSNDMTLVDDMILTQDQIDIINGKKEVEDRGIAPNWAKHWNFKDASKPGMVIVPFKLDYKFSYEEKNWIRKALKEIEAVSCIRYL